MTYTPQDVDITAKYKELNLLPLDDLYFLEVSKFMYRNSKSSLPSSFDEYFRNIDHHYNTRNRINLTLALPRPRTDLVKQSIKFTGIKVWGKIPLEVRNAESYDSFGSLLKTHLINMIV